MAKVNITMQDELLNWVDEYADNNYTSRSGAISFMVNQYKVSIEMQATIKRLAASLEKVGADVELTDEEKMQLLGFEQLVKNLPMK